MLKVKKQIQKKVEITMKMNNSEMTQKIQSKICLLVII